MTASRFPKGWDEARIRRVLEHYETQSEEAVAEDEAAFEAEAKATIVVPRELAATSATDVGHVDRRRGYSTTVGLLAAVGAGQSALCC